MSNPLKNDKFLSFWMCSNSPKRKNWWEWHFPLLLFKAQNMFPFILIEELMQSCNKKQRWNVFCREFQRDSISVWKAGCRQVKPARCRGRAVWEHTQPEVPSTAWSVQMWKCSMSPGGYFCQHESAEESLPSRVPDLLFEEEFGWSVPLSTSRAP